MSRGDIARVCASWDEDAPLATVERQQNDIRRVPVPGDYGREQELPPVRERVDCGRGFDRVGADKLDRVIDCEKRLRVPGGR